MNNLQCNFIVVGPVATNCYFLTDKNTKDTVIIDPGDDFMAIDRMVSKKELNVVAVFLTHGHFDHIGAVEETRNKYGVKVYASENEKEVLFQPEYNLSRGFMPTDDNISIKADIWLADNEIIELLNTKIKCISTPGHTVGGMCYYIEDEKVLFSGDTLFRESIGRTDFPGGSFGQLKKSVCDKLFLLPDDTEVYTGHGIPTSIGFEKEYNCLV